jgi:hypothetical protein
MKTPRFVARPRAEGATVGPDGARVADDDIRRLYRRLTAAGFGAAGSGNLSGFVVGLRPTNAGWSVREISGILFLRELVRQERIVH